MKKSLLGISLLSSLLFSAEVNANLDNAKKETYELINEKVQKFNILKECVDNATSFSALDDCANKFSEETPKTLEEPISYEEAIKEPIAPMIVEELMEPKLEEVKDLSFEEAIKK